jgi:hypothetical protein
LAAKIKGVCSIAAINRVVLAVLEFVLYSAATIKKGK